LKNRSNLAKLTNAHPGKRVGDALDFRISLFANGGDINFRAGFARSLEHEKGKLFRCLRLDRIS